MTIDITDSNYQAKTKALSALYEVTDPELGINIVDLGLVYNIDIDEVTKKAVIEMTLSTPSCPLGGIITGHATAALEEALEGFRIEVNLVWEPKWNAEHITAAGKQLLGW
jgi:metal-sulfur cluster biosynthetic enzyme